MRPEVIFMLAVLGIAAIHLLFRLVNFLEGMRGTGVQRSQEGKTRDDWYAFFKTSDLYGNKADTSLSPEGVHGDALESPLGKGKKDTLPPQEAFA